MKKISLILLSVLTIAFSVSGSTLVPVVSGTPKAPVTIVTAIDFSSFPFHGTFAVTVGSDILGCSKGNFVDTPLVIAPPIGGAAIKKAFTCNTGPGAGGSFTVLFEPFVAFVSRGNVNGQWRVLEGTGFFATLHGQGDFSVVFCDGPDPCPGFLPPPSGIETLTGTIHFD